MKKLMPKSDTLIVESNNNLAKIKADQREGNEYSECSKSCGLKNDSYGSLGSHPQEGENKSPKIEELMFSRMDVTGRYILNCILADGFSCK